MTAGDRVAGPSTGVVVLLVVAKAPVPGLVKTRLCPPATHEQAARLAAASLLDTVDTVLSLPWAVPVIAVTGDLDACVDAEEISARFAHTTVLRQRGADFAERLANAHQDARDVHPGVPVLQIGMDTPQVDAELLTAGARLLTARGGPRAVLAPATDGGWWALGLRDPGMADSLSSVPMSQVDTCQRTREALDQAGVPPAPLADLSDVDFMSDAGEVAASIPGSRFARALAEMTLHADIGR